MSVHCIVIAYDSRACGDACGEWVAVRQLDADAFAVGGVDDLRFLLKHGVDAACQTDFSIVHSGAGGGRGDTTDADVSGVVGEASADREPRGLHRRGSRSGDDIGTSGGPSCGVCLGG